MIHKMTGSGTTHAHVEPYVKLAYALDDASYDDYYDSE